MRTRFPFVLMIVVAAACGGAKDSPAADSPAAAAPNVAPNAASSSAEGELADVASYRLSTEKIDRFLAANRNMALKAKDLSPEQRAAIRARDEAEGGDANGSLEDMARKIESEPLMLAAVREAGLSAREYALITMSMLQTAMASGVLQTRPQDDQDSLVRAMKASPENVKFFREHEAEITRKQAELEAEMKRLGVTDGE